MYSWNMYDLVIRLNRMGAPRLPIQITSGSIDGPIRLNGVLVRRRTYGRTPKDARIVKRRLVSSEEEETDQSIQEEE